MARKTNAFFIRRTAMLLVIFWSFTVEIEGQVLAEAKPETVGVSTERLQRIDQVIQGFVENGQVPGVIAIVVRNGKIVYHKGLGFDDLDAKTPLKRDAIVRIASQSKAITSTAVMMLYEEGKFLLDDPVSRYLPAFSNPQILERFNPEDSSYTARPAKREITIRDLLTHTSGIGYAVIGTKEANAIYAKHEIPVGIGTPDASLAAAMDRLGKLPLFNEPGEKFLYGLNSDVLGYLVEVVSGKSLAAFLRERLFEPLGMQDTYFYLPDNKHSRLAWLYTEDSEKKTVKVASYGSTIVSDGAMAQGYPTQKGSFYAGGAGLSSTALDYAAFLQMLLNGGRYNGKQLLSPTTVRLMITNQIGHLKDGKNNFSLGFGITTEEQALRFPIPEGSFDWGGAFGTSYWADPVEGLACVLITQKQPSSWGGELTNKFKALVYQAIIQSNRK